jgi:transcriptional regulator with XRE-family HTH domain
MKKFSELRKHVHAQPKRAACVETYQACLLAELSLAEVRRARQVTQEALAASLDTTQSAVSRLEHQTDLYVSTLKKYIEAIGGRLQIFAEFPDMRIPIYAFPSGDLVLYPNSGTLPLWEHVPELERQPLEQRRRAVAAHRASLVELVQTQPPASPPRLLLEHDLMLLDAELGWLDRTLSSLSEQASAS